MVSVSCTNLKASPDRLIKKYLSAKSYRCVLGRIFKKHQNTFQNPLFCTFFISKHHLKIFPALLTSVGLIC